MAAEESTNKVHPGLVMKQPKRRRALDPLCYLKFAITNSFNLKQRQQGRDEQEVFVRLWRKDAQRKKLPVSKTGRGSNQLPNRKVDQLKRELTAVLKSSAAKLTSAQWKRKISKLETRMKKQSTKLRPKFEIRDFRRINLL